MTLYPLSESQSLILPPCIPILFEQVFGGMAGSVVAVLNSDQVSQVPDNPSLTVKIITALDTFHGIASSIVNKIIEYVNSCLRALINNNTD